MDNTRYSEVAFGRYFGYPACCVAEFKATVSMATKFLYPNGPWLGTGFIPCSRCAPAALDFESFVAEHITPNRLCHLPFPQQPTGPGWQLAMDKLIDEFDPASFPLPAVPPKRFVYRPYSAFL